MMLLAALAVLLQTHDPGSIPTRPLVTAAGEKVTCKLVWQAHSRVPDRVCRTDADWARYEKDAQDSWRSSRNSRGIACNPGAGAKC